MSIALKNSKVKSAKDRNVKKSGGYLLNNPQRSSDLKAHLKSIDDRLLRMQRKSIRVAPILRKLNKVMAEHLRTKGGAA